MKELEWIKELEEDFKSGDMTRFPKEAHLTHWENIPADEENMKLIQGINKIYLPFAKKGDWAEMRHLGEYFCIGREKLGLPVNYTKAIFWYSRAAEYKSAYRGDVLYMLAYCYEHARGANSDRKKAFKMFETLAKIDCSKIELPELAHFTDRAYNSLAVCYEHGYGTEKDINEAVKFYKEAADCGNLIAKNNLKRLKKNGLILDD